MNTKNCSKKECKMENPQLLENFHKNIRTKDGLSFVCKTCKNAYEDEYRKGNRGKLQTRSKNWRKDNPGSHKEWRDKNRDKLHANQKRYKDRNREEIRKRGLEHYYKNRDTQLKLAKKRRDSNIEKEKDRCKKYSKNNRGKVNARTARYRATKLQATPKWTTKEHKKEMQALYIEANRITKETGARHHVDHIVPLQGENVCGLHLPCNLRIILGSENESKNNRVREEDLEEHKKFVMDGLNNKKPSNK
jgi:hypothetical protein